MQPPNIVVFLLGFVLSSCGQQSLESQIVGSWTAICSIDVCTIISLAPDHTYSQRFEDSDSPYASGTWRVERSQLVLHMLSTRVREMKDSIAREQYFTVKNLQKDSFVVASTADQKTVLTWNRVH